MSNLKPFDFVSVLLSILVIGVFSAFAYRGGAGDELFVHIQSPHDHWIYPLAEDIELEVPGLLGPMQVVIENGSVRVISSPCPEKICILTGAISRPGNWIACLPSGIFLRIEGKSRGREPDAVTF